MSTEKTFVLAGVSDFQGVKTFRFSNSAEHPNRRANMLTHKGHTNVELYVLPQPMTQARAISYLRSNGVGKDAVVNTRSADKSRKAPALVAAEALLAKRDKAAKTRAANRGA